MTLGFHVQGAIMSLAASSGWRPRRVNSQADYTLWVSRCLAAVQKHSPLVAVKGEQSMGKIVPCVLVKRLNKLGQ